VVWETISPHVDLRQLAQRQFTIKTTDENDYFAVVDSWSARSEPMLRYRGHKYVHVKEDSRPLDGHSTL